MKIRNIILASILLANLFVLNPSLSSPDSHRVRGLTISAFAQKAALGTFGFDRNYKLALLKPVQDKNFYLLSLFQRNTSIRKLLTRNKVMRQLADDKVLALKKAATCSDAGCFDQLMRLNDSDIEAVATELQRLANRTAFKLLARRDMRPSGVFIKYSRASDQEMLAAAWKDAAKGMNRLLSVYGLGKDPRYKEIDRVSHDVSTEAYHNLVKARLAEIRLSKEPLFFEPTLDFALKLLEINRRDEAGRYEPLEQGENRAAVQNLKKIRWSDYPYSFILVLGSGGADLTTPISPIGAKRTDAAARLFLEHKAPLIIVSGGHVHPMQTPYCEAIEMKKYLMVKYKIPERSILIEPHARHTTTN
nr:YdcF family protein [Acidobacteriota bacterium]